VEATALAIVPATAEDWPEIATMRSAYFRSVGTKEYETPPGIWAVVKENGHGPVLACYSYAWNPDPSQFIVQDLYRAPGRRGVKALHKVIECLVEVAQQTPVLFVRDPANYAWAKAIGKHRRDLNIQVVGIVERMG
jgi:hypothetical protein